MTGQRLLPNTGLTNRWTVGTSGWGPGMDANLAALDALLFLNAISSSVTAPPMTPAQGDRYIVGVGGTGAWAGQDNKVAVYLDAAWTFYPPAIGWIAYVQDLTGELRFDGAAWSTGSTPYDFQMFRYQLPNPPVAGVGEPIVSLLLPRRVTLPVGLVGSRASLKVATTSALNLKLYQNATQVGTVAFAALATAGTFTLASATVYNPGDVFEVYPDALDPTARGLRLVIVGYR